MDIEPLWDLGGWFFFIDCMATPKTSSTVTETFAKSNSFLLLLTIFFIFILLLNPSTTISSSPSTMNSPNIKPFIPFKRLLLDASSKSSTTMNLHHKQTRNSSPSPSRKATRREFGAKAHEVPSGPNPISNR